MKTGRALWFVIASAALIALLVIASRRGLLGGGEGGGEGGGGKSGGAIAAQAGSGTRDDPRGAEIAQLLATAGPEAVAARLTADLPVLGHDRAWVASVASALVDALERSVRDPAFVRTLLPLVERLLEDAAANPERASAGELECLALLRVGQARYVDAVKLAELAIRMEPASARPNLVLARIYLALGEREAGLRAVALARRVDPDDPAAQLLEGRLFATNGDLAEKGVARMLAAFEASPDMTGAREEIDDGVFAATVVLLAQQRTDAAAAALVQVLAAIGRRPGVLHGLGKVAARRRAFDEAVDRFDEAAALAPSREGLALDRAEALRDAGYARLLAGDRDAAIERFERAIAVAPPEVDVAGMQAVIESARERTTARDPAAARDRFDQATKLYEAGDKEAAKKAFEESIELLPLNPLAHMNLGRIELELDHAKEAEGHLRTAITVAATLALTIDVEEAHLLLVRALVEQDAEEQKVIEAVDDYLSTYPKGRYRDALAKLRSDR